MAAFVNVTLTTSGADFSDATRFMTVVIPDDDDYRNVTTSYADTMSVTDTGGQPYPQARAAAMFMIRYLFPIVVFIGTAGNALSAAVLIRQRMRTTSLYAYLLALTAADTLVLYVSAFKTWVRVATGVEWLHASDAACRTLMYLFVVGLHLSAWLIVLVTLDRFIAVCLPLRAIELCTVRRARIMIGALTAFMLVANSHVFWTIRLQPGGIGSGSGSGSDALRSTSNINGSDWNVWTTPTTQFGSATDAWAPPMTETRAPPSPVIVRRRQSEPQCAPIPGSVFGNVTFNYIKLATYSLIPFFIVIILNFGIIWRAVHIAPKLRRNFGGVGAGGSESSGHTCKRGESARRALANGGMVLAMTAAGTATKDACPMTAETMVRPTSTGAVSQRRVVPEVRDVDDETEKSGCGMALEAPEGQQVTAEKVTARTRTPGTEGRRNSALIGNRSNKDAASAIQAKVTTMLLTVSFSWLCLTALFAFHSLLGLNGITPKSPDLNLLLKTTSFLLMYVNHGINLFLYCLTGRRFRLELQSLFSCVLTRRQSVTVAGQRLMAGVPPHNAGIAFGRSLPHMTARTFQTPPRASSSSCKYIRSD